VGGWERDGEAERVRVPMEDKGYSKGGTRQHSCFPGARHYTPLLAHLDLVTERQRLSALAGAPPPPLSACALAQGACIGVQPRPHAGAAARTQLARIVEFTPTISRARPWG
jgi:hypothetical protein